MPGSELEKSPLVVETLRERQAALEIFASQFLNSELQLIENQNPAHPINVIDFEDLESHFDSPEPPKDWEATFFNFISKIFSR